MLPMIDTERVSTNVNFGINNNEINLSVLKTEGLTFLWTNKITNEFNSYIIIQKKI